MNKYTGKATQQNLIDLFQNLVAILDSGNRKVDVHWILERLKMIDFNINEATMKEQYKKQR